MHTFENDIRTEVELLWDTGKLFARRYALSHEAVQTAPSLQHHTSPTSSHNVPPLQVSECPDNSLECPDLEDDSLVFERTMFCVEELVLEHCLSRQEFNCDIFLELLNGLSHFDVVRQVFFSKKRTRCLSFVLTSVLRKVFICLSVTRTQIDTITRLFKYTMLLLSDDNAQVAQKIHTNYNSCVREALTAGDEKN